MLIFYPKEVVIEFAPEYSKSEKIKRIAFALLLALFVMITHNQWVFPFIGWYADNAHCYSPLGYSGILVLWYFIFVGLPLLSAFIIGVFSLPLGVKSLIQQQFPPKGVKVYKPTVIIKGNKAKIKAIGNILAPLLFVVIALWGFFQVDEIPVKNTTDLAFSVCQKKP